MTARRPVVAIDGPAGAGKSTVTRRVADALGYVLLDTGALYRCVGLAASRSGVALDDDDAVGALAHQLAERRAVSFSGPASQQTVRLDGQDVSDTIRTPAASDAASRVSALPSVRAALLELQRGFGERGGLVVEGRDVGTVVFPAAEAKFYLTATSEARARRRYEELIGRGTEVQFEQVHEDVVERDRRDTEREFAPLRQAADAEIVDSTGLGIAEVVEQIVTRVRDLARNAVG